MVHSLLHSFAYYSYDSVYGGDDPEKWLSGGALVAVIIVSITLAILMIAAMWNVFEKAKKPGWAAIVPFYNTYVMLKIVGRPGWWLLLYFIPIVNIFIAVIVTFELAKVFGKGVGYTLLLLFLPVIGWPMLAWGPAKYKGALKH
jgi:hypothetical protein